jgi:hypothetical protein
MAKPLIPIAFVISLPLATVCLQSEGTPPNAPPGALQPAITKTNAVVDDEMDAKIRDAVLGAVTERHDNQLGIQKLKGELEAVIAVRDAAGKSASDIAARITKLESEAGNEGEQRIALVMEAFRQLLQSRLGESFDEERTTELTLRLAIQYRDFYTDMITRLQSAEAALDSALSVELRGPDEIPAGETAEYEFVVTNTGESELTGLKIDFRADEALLPKRATENYVIKSGSLVWNLGVLAPGEATKPLTVLCDAIRPNNSAVTKVLSSTDQGVKNSKTLHTAIRPSVTSGVTPAGTLRPDRRVKNTSDSSEVETIDSGTIEPAK